MCWMLQGWMPPQWALLGALFCVIRSSTYSYWINSYFGGALAAAGGALVFGALPRLRHGWKSRYGVIFALGLGLMANTRAYEGFVFSVPALVAILWWFFSAWKRNHVHFAAIIPGVAVLLLIAAGMGYYNWRNTGNPLLLPYVVNQREYHITKPFIWQTRYPIPNYRHQVMRTFYIFHELPDYLNRRNPGFYWDMACQRFEVYYDFYIWPLLIPFAFAMWAMMKSRKMRIVACTLVLVVLGLLVEQWPPEAHYAAPVLAVALIGALYGLRLMWSWNFNDAPVGPMLVRSVVIIVLLWSLVPLGNSVLDPYGLAVTIWSKGNDSSATIPINLERTRPQAQLEQTPGKHLVFVHFTGRELPALRIYNEPDLSNSKIIWAYDMGSSKNQKLMCLYPNRHFWFLDSTKSIIRLLTYEGSDAADIILAQSRISEAHDK